MGWTKHADAVLAHKDALTMVRAGLRSLVGKLGDRENYRKAVRLLRRHEWLCSALAYGHRDGVVKAELGCSVNFKHKDMGPITKELIKKGPSHFTFRRVT